METIRKLQQLLLYAGVEKEEYDELRPSIHKENTALLSVFSRIAAVIFFLLFLASLNSSEIVTTNTTTYLLSSIFMILIITCVHFVLPKYPALVMALVHVFQSMLYLFGISISMLHTDMPAVSAIAFLLVSPLLFYDRPIRLSAMIATVVAVFCVLVTRFKEPLIAQDDIWNAITFGVVAITATVFIMSIKIRALSQAKQIEYLSQTDLLTGVKNRNHYENRLEGYPDLCSSTLICVYADVNGLHEMNNSAGHPAGDKMLREVAEVMQQCFGSEHTYRIGGDEFVAFRVDGNPEALSSEIEQMRRELGQNGYNVSFGSAIRRKNAQGDFDIHVLVREAEQEMFAAKREFYRQSENDRRSR